MALSPGTRLGPYQILAPIGAGGMGEVYRARDTRLDRDVALKLLPEAFTRDPERLARFEREAKAVAALSHPNILAIHDFGSHDGTPYAAMELLEGETLRDRLAGGALPPRKAIEQAAQIARGFAAAHEKGIVHRDLKPENVFVTQDGHVKVLDFGLAAQRGPAASGSDATDSPTISRHTDPGTVLGTAGYMSPEQVRGHAADHRSDIFSFGCVLYEMLAGRRAFQRDTPAETMTAILKEDAPELPAPVVSALPGVDRLLRHCLEKQPEERFQSARDLAFHLQAIGEGSDRSGPRLPAGISGRHGAGRFALPLATLALGLVIGALLMRRRLALQENTEPAQLRPLTFSGQDGQPSASRDGKLVAFSSNRDGTSRIWIKQIGGGEAPLTEGEDRLPRFSPDGSSVLFLRAQGERQSVYRMAIVGGEPRRLVDEAHGADWSPDGQRLAFVRRLASGGQSLKIADLRSGSEEELFVSRELLLEQPRFSPDGRSVALILSAIGNNDRNQLLVVDLASRKSRSVTPRGYELGCLAWSGAGAQAVLARAGSVVGDPSGAPGRVFALDVASGRERSLFWTLGLFPGGGSSRSSGFCDVLSDGRLVFDSIQASINLREIELDAAGRGQVRSLTLGSSRDRQPAYSPDGQRIVLSSNRSGNLDLWVIDRRTGALRQLTDDPAQDWDPAFTPDARHVLWSSDRSGNLEIWMAGVDGSGARQVTHDGIDAENATATPDGAWIVHYSSEAKGRGISKVRADGSETTLLAAGPYQNPEVSPDGRYAAFIQYDRVRSVTIIRFVEIASGVLVPSQIPLAYPVGAPADIVWGRVRWMPDGRRVAFVGIDAAGLSGVFVQDFAPGRDTAATRRPLAGFSRDYVTESFGISPDGRRLTIATFQRFSSLWLAESLAGVEAPRRGPIR